MKVGEKRSFEDFVTTELDNNDQPKAFLNDLVCETEGAPRDIAAHQGIPAPEIVVLLSLSLSFAAHCSFLSMTLLFFAGCYAFITDRALREVEEREKVRGLLPGHFNGLRRKLEEDGDEFGVLLGNEELAAFMKVAIQDRCSSTFN